MPGVLIGQPASIRRRVAPQTQEVIAEVRTSGYALRVSEVVARHQIECEANLMDDDRIDD